MPYFELCESIWGGSPATHAISEGIEISGMVAEALESIASLTDTGSSSMPSGHEVAEDALSAEMVEIDARDLMLPWVGTGERNSRENSLWIPLHRRIWTLRDGSFKD